MNHDILHELSKMYRTIFINFTWKALEAAENALNKLKKFIEQNKELGIKNEEYTEKFVKALENDLNIPQALAVLWTLVKDKEISLEDKKATILDFDKVLGLGLK